MIRAVPESLEQAVHESVNDALADLWAKPDGDRLVSNWTHEARDGIGIFFVSMTDGTVQEIRYSIQEQRS